MYVLCVVKLTDIETLEAMIKLVLLTLLHSNTIVSYTLDEVCVYCV